MSNRLFIQFTIWLGLVLLPCVVSAQGYSILPDAMCWSISGADSSIVRLVLASSSASQPGYIRYVNLSGQAVNVTGGTMSYGYCCCNGGGGGGTTRYAREALTPYLLGIDVRQVGNIDSVGLDILGLTNLTDLNVIYFPVWDSLSNQNYRVSLSSLRDSITDRLSARNGLTFVSVADPFGGFRRYTELGGTLYKDTDVDLSNNEFTFTNGSYNFFRIDPPVNGGTVYMHENTFILQQNFATTNVYDAVDQSRVTFQLGPVLGIGLLQVQDTSQNSFSRFLIDNAVMEMRANPITPGGADTTYTLVRQESYDNVKLQVGKQGTSIVYQQLTVNKDFVKLSNGDITAFPTTTIGIEGDRIKMTGVPEYANDAAADADSTLPSGGVYTVTGDRALRIKP